MAGALSSLLTDGPIYGHILTCIAAGEPLSSLHAKGFSIVQISLAIRELYGRGYLIRSERTFSVSSEGLVEIASLRQGKRWVALPPLEDQRIDRDEALRLYAIGHRALREIRTRVSS